MQHKIIIYESPESSIGSLRPSLRKSFPEPDFCIQQANAADIHNGVLQSPDVRIFAVPGIQGVVSPYPAEFGTKGAREVAAFANRNHNVTLLFCAGISPFVSRTVYTPPWSAPIGRMGLVTLFNGTARGPVSQYARLPDREKHLSDIVVVPVHFRADGDSWQSANICYGNGTYIIPDNPGDPATEVLATFADVPDHPIAMIRHKLGQGTLYMSCIHPEIFYQEIGEGKKLSMARQLTKELKEHEPGREKLWNMFVGRVKQDLKP